MGTVEPSDTPVSERMIEDVAKTESTLLEKIREFAGWYLRLEEARASQMRRDGISPEEFMVVAQAYRNLDSEIRELIYKLKDQHVATIKQLAREQC